MKRGRMEFKLRPHPSGRPRDEINRKERSIWRVPDEGYVTPRLRERRRDLSLIGFTHDYEEDDGN